jgi:hypothetical protein
MNIDYQKVFDTLKVIIPWITGGLAGAILTFMLNRRLAKKTRPRLIVKSSSINYALPKHQKAFADLKVSYQGRAYDELSYHEIEVENLSQRVIQSAPFVISFPEKAQILDENILSGPIRHDIIHDQEELEPNQHRYSIKDLHPNDFCRIRFMVQNGEILSWYFRGSDEIEIDSAGKSNKGIDDLQLVVLSIALYIACGSIPLFSDALRGALIVFNAPLLYRLFSRWRMENLQKKQGVIYGPIVISDSGSVKLDFDPETGASSVSAVLGKEQRKIKLRTKSE